MQIRNPTLTLAVVAVAIAAAAGCSTRDAACDGVRGAQVAKDGLEASFTCCRRDAEGIYMQMTIRNTTDRDVMLGKEASSPIAVDLGSRRVDGTVYIRRYVYDCDGPGYEELTKVPGLLRINCHASETVKVVIPVVNAAEQTSAWHVRLEGAWSTGVPVAIDVPAVALKAATGP